MPSSFAERLVAIDEEMSGHLDDLEAMLGDPRRPGQHRRRRPAPPQAPHHDDQATPAHCHTLAVNAWVLSTTGYLEDAIDAEEIDGHPVSDQAKAHLSFSHFEAINPYGTMVIDIAGVLNRSRRPLRHP